MHLMRHLMKTRALSKVQEATCTLGWQSDSRYIIAMIFKLCLNIMFFTPCISLWSNIYYYKVFSSSFFLTLLSAPRQYPHISTFSIIMSFFPISIKPLQTFGISVYLPYTVFHAILRPRPISISANLPGTVKCSFKLIFLWIMIMFVFLYCFLL